MKKISEYGIGNTPLRVVEMKGNKVGFKLEQFNYLGSIKSRTAYYLIDRIRKEGLKEKKNFQDGKIKICESTSGNLGLALDYFCKLEKYEFCCLIDKMISYNKLEKLKKSGVNYEVVALMEGFDYRDSRIKRAQELVQQGYYWTNQYDNPAAIQAHYETTGPELFRQTGGKISHLVCAVGTGGTIIGISMYLKKRIPDIKIIGVEPYGSTIFGKEEASYISAGAGMKGMPGNVFKHREFIDSYRVVKDEDSIQTCKRLKDRYDISVGITSGMAFYAAEEIIENHNGNYIVIICPDGKDCYEQYF